MSRQRTFYAEIVSDYDYLPVKRAREKAGMFPVWIAPQKLDCGDSYKSAYVL